MGIMHKQYVCARVRVGAYMFVHMRVHTSTYMFECMHVNVYLSFQCFSHTEMILLNWQIGELMCELKCKRVPVDFVFCFSIRKNSEIYHCILLQLHTPSAATVDGRQHDEPHGFSGNHKQWTQWKPIVITYVLYPLHSSYFCYYYYIVDTIKALICYQSIHLWRVIQFLPLKW